MSKTLSLAARIALPTLSVFALELGALACPPEGSSIPGFRYVGGTHGAGRTITYAWDAPSGAPAGAVYEILQAESRDYCVAPGEARVVGETTALTALVTLPANDRVYETSVRLKDCPAVTSPRYVDDSFVTPAKAPVLSAQASGANTLTLTLVMNDATALNVGLERAPAGQGFTEIAMLKADALCANGGRLTWPDTGLPKGTYRYRAFSLNQGTGVRTYSREVSGDIIEGEAAPTIVSFRASSATVVRGLATTLSWNVDGASRVSLEPGLGSVSPDGSVAVTPTQPTRYTLVAEGAGGTASREVYLSVVDPSPTAFRNVVPVIVSAAGLSGAQWRTSLQIANPGEDPVISRLSFQPADGSAPRSLQLTLGAYQTVSLDNVAGDLGVTGHGRLDVDSSLRVLTVARIENVASEGTTGASLEAQSRESALATGEQGYLVAPGDPRKRVSLGIVALDANVSVSVLVRDTRGSVVVEKEIALAQGTLVQKPFEELLGVRPAPGQSLLVSVKQGPAFVYLTAADPETNDPSIELARPLR
ncbi:MAG: hypothetical protein JNK60_19525 [Acidobacteria bacterium]|nr:hypothetical protein [Acidobacteriota bacterium]